MPEGTEAKELRMPGMPAAGFSPFYTALFEGNQRAYTRILDGMFKISQEIAQFTQNRLQEDMAAWATLAACRDPREAVDCQRRFAEKATQQYADEINKLSHMMMTVTGDTLTSFEKKSDGAG